MDLLQLIGVVEIGLSVVVIFSFFVVDFYLNDMILDFSVGDVIIVCDFDYVVIVQIINYNSSNVIFDYNIGSVVFFGNCLKGLGYFIDCLLVIGNGYQFGFNFQIFKLVVVDWYIGVNFVGGQLFYRMSVGINMGGVKLIFIVIFSEMICDVILMVICYYQLG